MNWNELKWIEMNWNEFNLSSFKWKSQHESFRLGLRGQETAQTSQALHHQGCSLATGISTNMDQNEVKWSEMKWFSSFLQTFEEDIQWDSSDFFRISEIIPSSVASDKTEPICCVAAKVKATRPWEPRNSQRLSMPPWRLKRSVRCEPCKLDAFKSR